MIKTKKIPMIILSMLLILCLMAGCGEKKASFEPLPINVNGAEILLGQSTLQAFIDAGYKVTLDNKFEQDIAGQKMPSMTYDIAAYVSKDGKIVGKVSFLNNTKEEIPYEQCTVHEYEMNYVDKLGFNTYDPDNILVADTSFKGMKLEDVKKAFEGKVEKFDEFKNPDESIAIVSFYLNDVRISVSFDYDTKEVSEVKTEIFLSHFE
jgi:hypothetical protein